ncbi:hypothetical protein K438DRAFT_1925939 [Mycena galopus ATCC 62051]|nr:hypothetical protein K438DRAFT_1925939 [Mycena galopus ATCC 62051]
MPYKEPPSITGKPFVILGAGTAGRCIAMTWLTLGKTVHLVDPNRTALAEASNYISKKLPNMMVQNVPVRQPGNLVTFQECSEAVENAWIVVEAVPETLSLKVAVLGNLDAILPDDCILASNSSLYTGSEMSGLVKNKERLVNTHYHMASGAFSVEVMPNPYTDPAVIASLFTEFSRHGLPAYHVQNESAGLISTRIWAAIQRESLYVVAQGVADVIQVESIIKDVLGISCGVFELPNDVGVDVALDTENHIPPEPAAFFQRMVEARTLGVESGEGFPEKDRVIFLDVMKGEVRSLATDGKADRTLVSGLGNLPDAVQIDGRPDKGHIYWTNMGSMKRHDGFLSRSNIDGSDVITIVPPGVTHTPKQLVLDIHSEYLYWCDREGGKIQRCKFDGSQVETLYISASTPDEHRDPRTWCVGIAIDTERGYLYWTQKGGSREGTGRIFRANINCPTGVSPAARQDIEILFDGLPEPIDLELHDGFLYWTDRGDVPFGDSLNRADVSAPLSPSSPPKGPGRDLIIAERFHQPIGLTIDHVGEKVYIADLLGSLWVTDLDGRHKTAILRDAGNFTGIAFLPSKSA